MKLLAIGEVMAEIRGDEASGFTVGFAGDSYNTAVYCARDLGEQGSVGYMTRIGSDPLSLALRAHLEDEAIDATAIETDLNRNIGIYSVTVDREGERSFHYWRSQSAARQMFAEPADLEFLDQAEIIYLSGISIAILEPDARLRLIEKLKVLSTANATKIAFDSNYRPNLWEDQQTAIETTEALWQFADIALPSIDDEMALFGETEEQVIDRFQSYGAKTCAIKRGDAGPLSLNIPKVHHPEFKKVDNVVDTTAAGDSFNAGYLAAFIQGKDDKTCISKGHELASRVVQINGAIELRKNQKDK